MEEVEQRKAIRQFFERKDLLAVLRVWKEFDFQLSVLVARRAEARNFACLLVNYNATNIVNDQIV